MPSTLIALTDKEKIERVLLGDGDFDLTTTFSILETGGFDGVVCIEWERKWHPYLPPLDTALAQVRELRRW